MSIIGEYWKEKQDKVKTPVLKYDIIIINI